jgi:hypothetical protein
MMLTQSFNFQESIMALFCHWLKHLAHASCPWIWDFQIVFSFFSFLHVYFINQRFCFSTFLLSNITKYGYKLKNISFYGHKTTPSFWVLFVALNLVLDCIWPSENAFISTPSTKRFHLKCFLLTKFYSSHIPFVSKRHSIRLKMLSSIF